MTTLRQERFARTGLLAIEPKALLELFAVPEARANKEAGNLAIVDITGPLVQRSDWWCDSYEAIRARVHEAFASSARAVVLRIDSPGGDVPGCFETARALRAESERTRKPLYAYIDRACSAAYALASAATGGIGIGETCAAGSIGVLSSRQDVTQANAMRGVRIEFVSSGARKLDGNPDYPVSDAELAATQAQVDDLAAKFFGLVAELRPSVSAAQVESYQGGVFYGDAAVSAGLADAVGTFDQLLASASKGEVTNMFKAKTDYDVARTALEKVAKGKDANAVAAKRALAALAQAAPGDDEEEEAPDEEPAADDADDEQPAADAPAAPPAADAPAAPPAAEEPAAAAPAAAAAPPAASAPPPAASTYITRAEFDAFQAKQAREVEQRSVAALLAKRPDLSSDMRKTLAKQSLAAVRDILKAMPVAAAGAAGGARTTVTTVPAARGARSASTPTAEAKELDRRMGLSTQKLGCKREGNALIFGAVIDDDSSDATSNPRTAH